MTLLSFLNSLSNAPELAAALLTLATLLASMVVSLAEYYWRKAYYDFFKVPDFARLGVQSFLSPDFLMYGLMTLAIIGAIVILIPWRGFDSFIDGGPVDYPLAILACILIALIAFVLVALLFAFFNRDTLKMMPDGEWGIPDFVKSAVCFGAKAAKGVGLVVLFAVLGYCLLHDFRGGNQVISMVCSLGASMVLMLTYAYNWSRSTLSMWYKTAITMGRTNMLLLVETIDGNHFCMPCSFDDGVLKVWRKQGTFVPVEKSMLLERRYFSTIEVLD